MRFAQSLRGKFARLHVGQFLALLSGYASLAHRFADWTGAGMGIFLNPQQYDRVIFAVAPGVERRLEEGVIAALEFHLMHPGMEVLLVSLGNNLAEQKAGELYDQMRVHHIVTEMWKLLGRTDDWAHGGRFHVLAKEDGPHAGAQAENLLAIDHVENAYVFVMGGGWHTVRFALTVLGKMRKRNQFIRFFPLCTNVGLCHQDVRAASGAHQKDGYAPNEPLRNTLNELRRMWDYSGEGQGGGDVATPEELHAYLEALGEILGPPTSLLPRIWSPRSP